MLSASIANTIKTAGNILDLYPLNGTMIIWIKEKHNNNIIRVKDEEWNHSIYVASDNKADLTSLLRYIHNNDKPGMLELLGIPYTGSDPTALSLALDKALA
ncbi:MAG TPA: hypothetical protein VD694_07895, partial [Nitrososphaeraceae archaeon]|nr:hypothetical protein [Nitrososphaeraceae archaeon]